VTDVVAGTANVTTDHGSAMPFVKAGTMKALLVLDEKPSSEFPNVPTLQQYPLDFNLKAWFGVVAPAGLPRNVADQLQAASAKAASDPAYAERLPVGTKPSYLGARDFGAFMDADRKTYGEMIKKLNLKLE
jgi:tripartite-type tricarboxylate transporter receptor subunit TctC